METSSIRLSICSNTATLLFTFITTNLTKSQIREKYGNRIADRFNEMLEVIIFKNETYRDK